MAVSVGEAMTAEPGPAATGSSTASSYGQILKSTAMIGGSSLVNVGFSVVRMKALAVLLGPSGVGLMAMYNSMLELTQTLAGLGIQSSGVRQIAEAGATEDDSKVARIVVVLKRASIVLGLAGALLMVGLSLPLSRLTFGDGNHVGGIILLSSAVFLGLLASAQMALLQGMRRIADLARISMLSAMFGAVIAVGIIFAFGEAGIVPALVTSAAASAGTCWWYSRQIKVAEVSISAREAAAEASALLKLGVVFMASGFLTAGASYAVRLIVLRAEGVDAAGLYQAAWSLGGLYAGFILQAMGTDFYPRLTAAAQDDMLCNRLVNEQAQVSILLAGPGLLATLTVAPLLMIVFYSPEFQAATAPLRWLCLGLMLRVVAWPMGFIVLAKGARAMFFWTEVAATIVHVGLAWLLVPRVGLAGAGAAFTGLYLWHTVLIYFLVRRLSGFQWSATNLRLGLLFLPTSALVFLAFETLPIWPATAIGAFAFMVAAAYSLKALLSLFPDWAPLKSRARVAL
jgi:PST family polysaccharide transporter